MPSDTKRREIIGRLTPERFRRFKQSQELFRKLCELAVETAEYRLETYRLWSEAGGIGKPPGDHERELLRRDCAERCLTCLEIGAQPRGEWVAVVMDQSDI